MNKVVKPSVIKVGMADLNVVYPPHTIKTSGLGSCVGVVIYDEIAKMAGMAHIMLPDSTAGKVVQKNRAKYADTAIDDLVVILTKHSVSSRVLKAKLAGGAQMFSFSSTNEVMRIGPRNVEAVKKALKRYSIRIISEDVGGKSGRTIEFNPETFILNIRTVNQGVTHI